MASKPAVLGRGLKVRGRVRGDGDLRVEAQVEGDISVSGALVLDDAGSVTGAVHAQSVVISGTLEGDITSEGAVTIATGGAVRGNVQASEVSLEEGGSFSGRIDAQFDLPDAIA